ncbi:MAG: hypothetical protein ACTSSE_14740 [Candidatus Thorarchaeota archaeon]
MMNRNQIANVVVLIAIVVMLVVAWYIMPGGFWGGVLSIPFTIMIVKAMEKYRDERFTQILNISMRNGFVFLLFALPWTGALLVLNILILDALPAIILFLWFTSMAVTYGSGVYYFRK